MKKFFILIILLSSILLLIFLSSKHSNTINVFSPINLNSEYSFDINGDGSFDKITFENSKINITCNNEFFCLNDLCDYKTFQSSDSFPVKVFIKKLTKKNSYDIIVQFPYDNKSKTLIFTWDKDKFINLLSEDKNIFGILDYNTSKTPQYFLLDSSVGLASKNSYMLIGNENVEITNDSLPLKDLNSILKLIGIVEADYEVDEDYNIFTENIDPKDLYILWTLDKSKFVYSFQDAYFENNKYDNESNLYSTKWRITFEKYLKGNGDSSKTEFVIYVTTEKFSETEFKVSSISFDTN